MSQREDIKFFLTASHLAICPSIRASRALTLKTFKLSRRGFTLLPIFQRFQ